MCVSVFLGGFGFGNLGDEACLATAYNLYKSEVNCTFTHDEVITSKAANSILSSENCENCWTDTITSIGW
jgi:hypothetical protein